MGLTTQYLRYVPFSTFGVVASRCANVLFVDSGIYKNCIIVPACENALLWNYRTCEIVKHFRGEKHAVTVISGTTHKSVTLGYTDGSIRIFDIQSGNLNVLFQGHKSPVSSLAYDSEGLRLASGGKDTEIVLWDVVGEKGLFRLKGHKGPITKCQFLKSRNVLISSSEDTFLKFWDLDSQHCFKTLVGNRGEVWDFLVLESLRLFTGVNDTDLRVWDLIFKEFPSATKQENEDSGETLAIKEIGRIVTEGEKRTISISVDNTERLLGCHGYSNTLQLFKLLNYEEAKKRMKKRKKRERKINGDEDDAVSQIDDMTIILSDEIKKMKPLKTEAKIIGFTVETENLNDAKIAVLLNNNSFSVFGLDLSQDCEPQLCYSIKSPGHRSNVSTLAFSLDNQMLLSASGESMKIWNYESQKCTHTFKCEYALCSTFVTGNTYCIVGTKAGNFQIFDLATQNLVETVDAHTDAISSMSPNSNQNGITSGSKDKDIKFWNYELVKDTDYSETKKRLTLTLARTMKMPEEILCLKHCPKQKYLAVSLLDCTVKVLFSDTLKFAFSLYGHKLPIPCIDISYDSTLLISGSKDRNIKIWSLEFGNCLKSIFAHEESITCLQFLPKTHMFFSGGKDKKVKQWDADNFQKVITLEGHQAKINAISISPDGRTVATSSDDKTIRLWEKTDEPLVLEEEQENERELEADTELALEELAIVGETNKEVGLAAKRTVQTIKSAEQLIEAIDIYKEEICKLEEHELISKTSMKPIPPPEPHKLLQAYKLTCPYRYMLKMLQNLQSSNLEQTLLHTPFHYVKDFMKILTELVARNWEIEICTRCILFLLRVHLRQILNCQDMVPLLMKLRKLLIHQLSDDKDTIGFNLAGLNFLQREIEQSKNVSLFEDASKIFKRKGRKRHLINFV